MTADGFGLVIGLINHFNTQLMTTLDIVPSLISTLYKSLQHMLSLFGLLCLHHSFPGNGF
jgi:hypothetical protein